MRTASEAQNLAILTDVLGKSGVEENDPWLKQITIIKFTVQYIGVMRGNGC